jgi:hypothetical protein
MILTKKFARRFVMPGPVIIFKRHRYLNDDAGREAQSPQANEQGVPGRITMRKTMLTLLGSALLVTATVQFALAAQHHQGRKLHRAPTATTEQFRDSNAAWPQQEQGDWSRYSGGYSAPAGR